MPKLVAIHEFVEANGKTIKENNLARPHVIPLGTLVEARWDEWFGGGACMKIHARLWVVHQGRDCDGTPLYGLSRWRDPAFALQAGQTHHGFSEERLIVIEITEAVRRGDDALEWEDEEE